MANKWIFFILSVLLFCQCTVEDQPAIIKEVKVCTELVDGKCQEDLYSFSKYSSTFYVSCMLENAKEESTVTFRWYFVNNGSRFLLDEIKLKPSELAVGKSRQYEINANLNRTSVAWQKGKYEIEVSLNTDQPTLVLKSFEI